MNVITEFFIGLGEVPSYLKVVIEYSNFRTVLMIIYFNLVKYNVVYDGYLFFLAFGPWESLYIEQPGTRLYNPKRNPNLHSRNTFF